MAIFNRFFGLRGRNLSRAITFVSGCLFVAFGWGQGDVGGLIIVGSFRNYFRRLDYLLDKDVASAREQGLVIATWNIGCFASAILTIFIGDHLGRRKTLLLGSAILAIGKLLQATSFSYPQYIAGRFIAGFGNGFNASTVPAWQAECTKAHRRGRMLMISSGACITLGVALAYWTDFAMSWTQPSQASWRFPIAGQCIWLLPAFVMLNVLPESPRWLILQGREQEALEVLGALNDLHPAHQDVRSEFLQIKDTILQMASGSTTSAFKMGEYRYLHRIILAVLLQVMQQWSGINMFIQWLAAMFAGKADIQGWKGLLLAATASSEFFLISFVTVIGIDRFWGRRTLTMFGSSGMSMSMTVLAIMAYYNTATTKIVLAVMIYIYISFFAIGWQGMSWLWAVELVPLAVRGPANALATSANWLSNFAVVLVAPIMFATIGWKTYVVFAVLNFIFIPTIYFLYPETGCRSLEEVDVLFHLASQSTTTSPWLAVRDVAISEPLWYGKNGNKPFAYEQSEWHMRFARLSSEEEEEASSISNTHNTNNNAITSEKYKYDNNNDKDDVKNSSSHGGGGSGFGFSISSDDTGDVAFPKPVEGEKKKKEHISSMREKNHKVPGNVGSAFMGRRDGGERGGEEYHGAGFE